MAVTKILARNTRLDQAIQYVLNGDKTDHQILTAHQNCDPGREYEDKLHCLTNESGRARLQHPLSPAVRTWHLSPLKVSELIAEPEKKEPKEPDTKAKKGRRKNTAKEAE